MKFLIHRAKPGTPGKTRIFLENGTELTGLYRFDIVFDTIIETLEAHAISEPAKSPGRWEAHSLTLEFARPELELITEPPVKLEV